MKMFNKGKKDEKVVSFSDLKEEIIEEEISLPVEEVEIQTTDIRIRHGVTDTYVSAIGSITGNVYNIGRYPDKCTVDNRDLEQILNQNLSNKYDRSTGSWIQIKTFEIVY